METIFIVLSSFESERRKIISCLSAQYPSLTLAKYEAGTLSVSAFLEVMQSPDLFSPSLLLILDKVELLKKEESQLISQFLQQKKSHPFVKSCLVLSGSSFKASLTSLPVKKYDLTQEKPWERLSRLKQWLQEEAKASGKTLAPQVINFLLEEVSQDFGQLQLELAKLICYVGDASLIDLKEAKAIITSQHSLNGWQVAEALIWESKIGSKEPPFEISLIGQMRYHLQLGLQIASLIELKFSSSEILMKIPSLKEKTLDKYLPVAQKKGASFFKQGLQALFECEIKCKNSGINTEILWTRFKACLNQLFLN